MPSVRELAGRNYYVNVTSPNGEFTYMRQQQLYFSSDDFGFLFVKTDKPIYKPEQDGESSVRTSLAHYTHSLTLSNSLSLSFSLSLSCSPFSRLSFFIYLLQLLFLFSLPSLITIVKFCLAFLDKTLKPHRDNNEVSFSDVHVCVVISLLNRHLP